MRGLKSITIMALLAAAAYAQDTGDPFSDGPNGAKLHSASGFVCPSQLGPFERDAVGRSDPETGADFCAYSALDGVYGTITLMPLPKTYDPKALLAPEFVVQEGSGGQMVGEATQMLGSKTAPLAVFTRTYETAKLESMHYRTLFANPRDLEIESGFLDKAYADALAEIAGAH